MLHDGKDMEFRDEVLHDSGKFFPNIMYLSNGERMLFMCLFPNCPGAAETIIDTSTVVGNLTLRTHTPTYKSQALSIAKYPNGTFFVYPVFTYDPFIKLY